MLISVRILAAVLERVEEGDRNDVLPNNAPEVLVGKIPVQHVVLPGKREQVEGIQKAEVVMPGLVDRGVPLELLEEILLHRGDMNLEHGKMAPLELAQMLENRASLGFPARTVDLPSRGAGGDCRSDRTDQREDLRQRHGARVPSSLSITSTRCPAATFTIAETTPPSVLRPESRLGFGISHTTALRTM